MCIKPALVDITLISLVLMGISTCKIGFPRSTSCHQTLETINSTCHLLIVSFNILLTADYGTQKLQSESECSIFGCENV
uniref:Secreted protein n=1 Tax=Setaria italica TaxID=4555 RepID=K3ZBD6_SETIT